MQYDPAKKKETYIHTHTLAVLCFAILYYLVCAKLYFLSFCTNDSVFTRFYSFSLVLLFARSFTHSHRYSIFIRKHIHDSILFTPFFVLIPLLLGKTFKFNTSCLLRIRQKRERKGRKRVFLIELTVFAHIQNIICVVLCKRFYFCCYCGLSGKVSLLVVNNYRGENLLI